MGRGKRVRAAEEGSSPPRPKQPKMDSFSPADHNTNGKEMSAAKTQNSSHLLDALRTGSQDGEEHIEVPPGTVTEAEEVQRGYREASFPGIPAKPLPSSKQDIPKQNVHYYGAASDQIQLIIRTLNCIFKSIREMSSYLDKLSQTLAVHPPALSDMTVLPQNPSQPARDTNRRQTQKPLPTNLESASSKQFRTHRPSQSLILQPNKICLMVCSREAPKLRWNNPKMAKRYLRDLLCIPFSQVDLTSVDSLNDVGGPKKFLLAFESSRLPQLMIRRKDLLAHWDIFPTRVFWDGIVRPLLVNAPVGKVKLSTVTAPTTKPQPFSQELPPPVPAISSKTVGYDQTPNGRWDSDEERNLLISYSKLPSEEQQTILERLDLLKQRLLGQNASFIQWSQEPRCSISHEASPPKATKGPQLVNPPSFQEQTQPLLPDQRSHFNLGKMDKPPAEQPEVESFSSMPELESTWSDDRAEMKRQFSSLYPPTSPVVRAASLPPAPVELISNTHLVVADAQAGHTNQAALMTPPIHLQDRFVEVPTSCRTNPMMQYNSTPTTTSTSTCFAQIPSRQSKITDFFTGPSSIPKDTQVNSN